MRRWTALAGLLAVLAGPSPALPCSLCYNIQQSLTLRQEAAQAKLVLYGPISNARLGAGTSGLTDLRLEAVLKADPFVAGKQTVELPRYLPVKDAKDPPRYLVFCDIFQNKLDPYRGVPIKSPVVVDYLKGAMALDPKDTGKGLLYFFRYLEHADPEVARDAFLEFAKANDQDVGRVARGLAPDRLRGWLKDPQTPSERLSLYAFLLGACGGEQDDALLKGLLQDTSDRTVSAMDGIVAGYLQLRPREGWDLVQAMLKDEKKPFPVRFAVLRTLRFHHGWKPDETREPVLKGLAVLLPQGDIADLAVEDLRRWKMWDLTRDVLAVYGQKTHDAPLMRRTIVRYALSCPRPEAKEFLDRLRKSEPRLVSEVEESLRFENAPPDRPG